MRRAKCNDGTIVTYCDTEEDYHLAMNDSDFVVVSRKPDLCYEDRLQMQKQGFVFSDRAVKMRYRLSENTKSNDEQKDSSYQFQVCVGSEWDIDALMDIAQNYFDNDCRFSGGISDNDRKKL
jgi:hypothetical protein